jgi:hypothetical protein
MELTDVTKVIIAQAIITGFALLVGYIAFRQEMSKFKRQRLYDMQLDRLKQQLSELYGPIYMITKSTKPIVEQVWGTDVWNQVWKETIIPSQTRVEDLLLTKIHLLEEKEIPKSYLDFLTHIRVARSYVQSALNQSYFDKQLPYPYQFDEDIEGQYNRLRKNYIELLDSI